MCFWPALWSKYVIEPLFVTQSTKLVATTLPFVVDINDMNFLDSSTKLYIPSVGYVLYPSRPSDNIHH